jgi:hypothetical protein
MVTRSFQSPLHYFSFFIILSSSLSTLCPPSAPLVTCHGVVYIFYNAWIDGEHKLRVQNKQTFKADVCKDGAHCNLGRWIVLISEGWNELGSERVAAGEAVFEVEETHTQSHEGIQQYRHSQSQSHEWIQQYRHPSFWILGRKFSIER